MFKQKGENTPIATGWRTDSKEPNRMGRPWKGVQEPGGIFDQKSIGRD